MNRVWLIRCDFDSTMTLCGIYMRLLHFGETRLEDLYILSLQAFKLRASIFQDVIDRVVQGKKRTMESDKARYSKLHNQAQERDNKPSSTLKSIVHIVQYSIVVFSYIKL